MVVVTFVVLYIGVRVSMGVLFSGLKEEELLFPCLEKKELRTVFFKPCKRSALGFPEEHTQDRDETYIYLYISHLCFYSTLH